MNLRVAMRIGFALWLWFCVVAGLSGCTGPGLVTTPESTPASTPESVALQLQRLPAFDVLLLGEQHDNPDHQRIALQVVAQLAARQGLAALVMEMADRGKTTQGLPFDANEADVQRALQWNDSAWPWRAYGPVVMAAVGKGIAVWGGNLPRNQMRDVMTQVVMDIRLDPQALKEQQEAIREGHCNALPESQIAPMARIQIARDIAMAQTIAAAAHNSAPRSVVLLAGYGHVNKLVGIPRHWQNPAARYQAVRLLGSAQGEAVRVPASASFDAIWPTAPIPPKDYCAEFKAISR